MFIIFGLITSNVYFTVFMSRRVRPKTDLVGLCEKGERERERGEKRRDDVDKLEWKKWSCYANSYTVLISV